MSSPPSTYASSDAAPRAELNDLERAVLRATRTNSLSTVAIAEQVGLADTPTALLPTLDRLERLELLDGYYAAGRVMTSASEVHRKYYRANQRGLAVV